jgi:hypothetical protein
LRVQRLQRLPRLQRLRVQRLRVRRLRLLSVVDLRLRVLDHRRDQFPHQVDHDLLCGADGWVV